jgi:hypothetical protein
MGTQHRAQSDPSGPTSGVSRRAVIKIGTALIGLSSSGLPLLWSEAPVGAQEPPPNGTPGARPGEGGPRDGGPPGGNEAAALAEPFVGITTDGEAIPGLFPIAATGVSTAPVVQAATAFLTLLTEEQQAATLFPVGDLEWRQWSNVDSYQRQGVSLRELTETQRATAMALLGASLSAAGLEETEATMKLNHTEGELMGDLEGFDEDLYWFTVMGVPTTSDPGAGSSTGITSSSTTLSSAIRW